ncbi:hypothetical protein Pfo_021539 [Paulownia fortunei]|nr:hypothetical protein Pfo_021539 [Paulownia fortunei]
MGDHWFNASGETNSQGVTGSVHDLLMIGGSCSSILIHGSSWLYGSYGGDIELQELGELEIKVGTPKSAGTGAMFINSFQNPYRKL